MAFQNVSIIGAPTPIIPVGVDAGPDRFVICEFTVTLTATITVHETDTELHNYQWVQLSGPSVTWLTSQHATSATYEATDSSDRSFRIYVDRFSLAERYDDIVVYGTPNSTHKVGDTVDGYNTSPCRNVTLSHLSYTSAVGSLDPVSQYELSWTAPTCDDVQFIEFHVQQKTTAGPWITLRVVGIGEIRKFVTPNINGIFRVTSVYNDGFHQHSNWIYESIDGKAGIMQSSHNVGSTVDSYTTNFVVQMLTKKELYAGDSTHIVGDTVDSYVTNYVVVQLTKKDLYGGDSTHIVGDTVDSYVTNYVVDELTGIGIGG